MNANADEIERAGERCKAAAANIDAKFLRLCADPHGQMEEIIGPLRDPRERMKLLTSGDTPAHEAIEAFEHVRDRILPRLDFLLKSEDDPTVLAKYRSLKREAATDLAEQKLTILSRLQKGSAESSRDPGLIPVANVIATMVVGATLAMSTLPDMASTLLYLSVYIRTRADHEHAKLERAGLERGKIEQARVEQAKAVIYNNTTGNSVTFVNTNSSVGGQASGEHASINVGGNVGSTSGVRDSTLIKLLACLRAEADTASPFKVTSV